MTDYPYEPPERMFSDTMLAFRDFELASTWAVRVEPDPLGPVNKIITLMRGGQRIKSVLRPVATGTTVRMGFQGGTGLAVGPGWRAMLGYADVEREHYRPPAWWVEVDGRRVIEVAEHEIPAPAPLRRPIPWRTRAQWRLRKWFYAAVDRVVVPLGYHHGDDCGDYR